MRHFFVTIGALALLATPALVLPQAAGAAPAEVQQAKAVQYGVYKNASGQIIEVVTLADGGVMAVVDGSSVLTGQKALDFLLANGIDLTIMGGGHIMGQTLTKGATVVTAARKATPADAEKLSQATQGAVNVVAKQAVRPPSVLPETWLSVPELSQCRPVRPPAMWRPTISTRMCRPTISLLTDRPTMPTVMCRAVMPILMCRAAVMPMVMSRAAPMRNPFRSAASNV